MIAQKVGKWDASLSQDEIDDIAQDLLVKLQRPEVLAKVAAARSPQNYLFAIVRHQARDIARREQRILSRRENIEREIYQAEETDLPDQGASESVYLRTAMDLLGVDDRELLVACYWNDVSIEELARRLGVSYSTIAVRLHRARRRLAKFLSVLAEEG